MDDFNQLRNRNADYRQTAGNRANRSQGRSFYSGQIYDGGSIPTSVPKMFLTHPSVTTCAETEGATPTVTVDTSKTVPVLILGPKVPVAGDNVLPDLIDGLWVASTGQGSGGGGTLYIPTPGCPCSTTPAILTMTSGDTVCDFGVFQSDILTYQTTPIAYATLGLGASGWFGNTMFTDSTTGDQFQYYFDCIPGFYRLRRLYPTSIFASPYDDGVRYTWAVPHAGNSCPPSFALTIGLTVTNPGCQFGPGSLIQIVG